MNSVRRYYILISTLFFFNVSIGISQNCIYPTSDFYLQNSNCSLTEEFCLDIPFANRGDYEVYVDGVIYGGAYTPCKFEVNSFYNTTTLRSYMAAASNPDLIVDSVFINGIRYSFEFTSLKSLADSLDAIDDTSDWTLNSDSSAINHVHNSSTYSTIFYNDRNSISEPPETRFQSNTTPVGMTIAISNNPHEIVLNEIATTCRDTISVDVYCLDNRIQIDTVEIDQIDTVCFTLDDLRGDLVSIDNICPDQSGTYAMIDPISGTACVEITGLDVGRDSACFVLVDSEGLSDTITYTLQVIQPIDQDQFFAADDNVTTIINEPIIFNPTLNDGIPNVLDTIYIVTPPSFGTAVVNPDGTFSYEPDLNYESNGVPDSVTYLICIMSDCRLGTAYINVIPPVIDVKTGFSPNEDGINDTFVIVNIDRFPNNQLCVFNRWGNQVLQVENYQNNWDGTWEESNVLPDGTYYYVLDVEVDSAMEQFTGFIQLRR